MDSSLLYLVIGFLAGSLASGLLILWISNQNRKKQDDSLEKRNQIIQSIAEIFTDIDSLITSFRTNLLSEDKFRTSLYSKLDAANKIYKPNMHLFDLYYVKFTDMQFARYRQIAHGKITSLLLDGQIAFDNEIASVEESSNLTQSRSDKDDYQSSVGLFSDKPDNESSEAITKTKKEVAINDVCVLDEEAKDDQIQDFEFVSTEPDENQAVVADEQPVMAEAELPVVIEDKLQSEVMEEEQPAIVDEQPAVVDEQPAVVVDEQPVVIDEQPVIIDEKQPEISEEPDVIVEELSAVEDSKDAENLEDEIVFEVNPDKAADKKGSPSISNTTIEVSRDAGPDVSTDGFAEKSAQEQKSAFQKEFEQVAKEPQDEEMLETIMDLDMGKFLRAGSINIESIDKNTLPPKYASSDRETDDSAEKVEKIKEEVSAAEEPQKTTNSAIEAKNQEKIVIARGDDGNLDTILDEAPEAELNDKSDEINDVSITGDDVASKIDSFFGIK
jgi:hypothetical protein